MCDENDQQQAPATVLGLPWVPCYGTCDPQLHHIAGISQSATRQLIFHAASSGESSVVTDSMLLAATCQNIQSHSRQSGCWQLGNLFTRCSPHPRRRNICRLAPHLRKPPLRAKPRSTKTSTCCGGGARQMMFCFGNPCLLSAMARRRS